MLVYNTIDERKRKYERGREKASKRLVITLEYLIHLELAFPQTCKFNFGLKFTHKISAYLKSANWIKSSREAGKKVKWKKKREKFLPSPVYFALHHVNVSFCPAKSFRHLFSTPFFDLVMCWKTKFFGIQDKETKKEKFPRKWNEKYIKCPRILSTNPPSISFIRITRIWRGGGEWTGRFVSST